MARVWLSGCRLEPGSSDQLIGVQTEEELGVETTIDSKRSGVRAVRVTWGALEWRDDRGWAGGGWYGEPGSMVPLVGAVGIAGYLIACPGCGRLGGPKEGARWEVTAGNPADVTTLTVRPSIAKDCCGWHGYLTNGVFTSC